MCIPRWWRAYHPPQTPTHTCKHPHSQANTHTHRQTPTQINSWGHIGNHVVFVLRSCCASNNKSWEAFSVTILVGGSIFSFSVSKQLEYWRIDPASTISVSEILRDNIFLATQCGYFEKKAITWGWTDTQLFQLLFIIACNTIIGFKIINLSAGCLRQYHYSFSEYFENNYE